MVSKFISSNTFNPLSHSMILLSLESEIVTFILLSELLFVDFNLNILNHSKVVHLFNTESSSKKTNHFQSILIS
jgi:hypothetical protein